MNDDDGGLNDGSGNSDDDGDGDTGDHIHHSHKTGDEVRHVDCRRASHYAAEKLEKEATRMAKAVTYWGRRGDDDPANLDVRRLSTEKYRRNAEKRRRHPRRR